MNPTWKIILDDRRVKKTGKFPLKVRLTYQRKHRLYNIGIDLTLQEWEKLSAGNRISKELNETKLQIEGIEEKVRETLKAIKKFSHNEFESKFYSAKVDKDNVYDAFKRYSQKLRQEDRVKTAISYECACNSLSKFKSAVSFSEIDKDFLEKYESWMLKQGSSLTTVGIYLRSLRALINEALEDGIITSQQYPFGKKKYQIPSGRNIKKALTLEEVGKIFTYSTDNETEVKYRDFWNFSYLAQGMNIADIANLKYSNIHGDRLEFIRKKTAGTRREAKPISVLITEDMQAIIKKYGNKKISNETYLFPILKPGMTAEEQVKTIAQFVKQVNKYVGEIAGKVGITGKKVTTYVSRHSFSTILKRSGASIEFISEALGHADFKTTQSYLDSFDKETKKQFADALTGFRS